MKIVVARFRNAAEFLARHEDSFPYGGIFVPTRQPLVSGEDVIVDVRMPALHDSMMLRGRVNWSRRTRRGSGQPAGMSIEFLPLEQRKRDYLLSLARGRITARSKGRRHKRLPLYIPGSWRLISDRTRHSCTVADIGSGGAFLQTLRVLPVGTPVVLGVTIPGGVFHQDIEARVAWSRDTPGDAGFGIEFRCRDMAGKRRIRELVRRLEEATLERVR